MTQSLSVPLEADILALAQGAARWRGMSLDEYIISVVGRAASMDAELEKFVQEGIESADRGDLISQEEMEAWFDARLRPAAAE